MKERPILFSGPMVRAILEGRKTQTRRVVKPQPPRQLFGIDGNDFNTYVLASRDNPDEPDWSFSVRCPYGGVGDRLWVRETWQINHVLYDRAPIPKAHPVEFGSPVDMLYRADGEFSEQFEIDEGGSVWRPAIHMPRWASRITLEITGVRVERVAGITHKDAHAEGIALEPGRETEHLITDFRALWNSINELRGYSWDTNPWVWAITFKRMI